MAGGWWWASGWPGTHREEGGVVDRKMGVSEPAEHSQFAYLNKVSGDRDIFKKNIKME